MYREEVRFDRLPNECGGDATKPFRKVVGLFDASHLHPAGSSGWDYEDKINPPKFIGFTNAIKQTPDGQQHAIPIVFKIDAPTFEKAFEDFDAAAEKYVQDRIKEEQDIQRRRKIVVAGEVPASERAIQKAIEGIR